MSGESPGIPRAISAQMTFDLLRTVLKKPHSKSVSPLSTSLAADDDLTSVDHVRLDSLICCRVVIKSIEYPVVDGIDFGRNRLMSVRCNFRRLSVTSLFFFFSALAFWVLN